MVFTVFTYAAAAILLTLIVKAIIQTAAGIIRVASGMIAIATSHILTIAAYMGRANRNIAANTGRAKTHDYGRRLLPAASIAISLGKSRIKMKTSISDRLAAAAANARKLGQGAFKNPVSSILSLCVLMAVTATIITYSQETAPADKAADTFVPPTLPMEVYGILGRKIPVTVLEISEDKAEILIRTREGDIKREDGTILKGTRWMALRSINPEIVEKLTGSKTPVIRHTGIDGRVRPLTEKQKEAQEFFKIQKSYEALPPKELLEKLKSGDPNISFNTRDYKMIIDYWGSRDPSLTDRFRPGTELLQKIEIKDGDEKVSLRPEFEKLGMVAHQQETDTCFQHAAYHLYQYQLRKHGQPAPSYEKFIQLSGGGVGHAHAMLNFKLPDGRKLRGYHLSTGQLLRTLEVELVKHQLRNGHPCIIGVPLEKYPIHIVLAIGFETKDGKTTIEYQDSNRVWQDKGIKTVDATKVEPFTGGISVWFE